MYTATMPPKTTTQDNLEEALAFLEYRQTPEGTFEEDGKHYGFKDKWFFVDGEVASTLIDRYTELLDLQSGHFEAHGEAKDDILKAIESLRVILAEIQA